MHAQRRHKTSQSHTPISRSVQTATVSASQRYSKQRSFSNTLSFFVRFECLSSYSLCVYDWLHASFWTSPSTGNAYIGEMGRVSFSTFSFLEFFWQATGLVLLDLLTQVSAFWALQADTLSQFVPECSRLAISSYTHQTRNIGWCVESCVPGRM